ncbi:MAG: PIN domain-containing protein [Deltaproteobacteria bacterium]|nr:PIN domain-containing protein [Deltaproteobacteria bacterium]MBW1736940.1 PIN domain-containing protein [Deltaproteobacteria bacterium]MBW1910143.1 PIN domain-containing protein [Deltaproteobacteria bacterium]MBW2034088.1 PIN domain-containing protein [Deltaproteobacteria bacterium]MBW2114457.1 PIN domain-containing protein [Deltaproteobacteria bacterium]
MKLPQKVYLIDTNVVLRYLLGDHQEFSPKAEAFMTDVSEGTKKVEILDVVIVECVYVMEKYYEVPKSEIVEKLSRILNFSGIVNDDRSEILEALLKYENLDIDIVDCILAARSSHEKIVISFDKDMEKLKAVSETP